MKNLKKFERLNGFWPNSIPKFLDRYNILVCSFRTIDRILRKLELPRPFFKNIKILQNNKSGINKCHENSHDLRAVIALLVYEISYRYLKLLMSYRGLKLWKSDTHAHTHTHTSGRQLKSRFLDVLDYSEYSDTNISKFFFHENIASSMRKQYKIYKTKNWQKWKRIGL